MHRLSTPMKVILSSGSFLALLALCSLVCMSHLAHTSDIVQKPDQVANFKEQNIESIDSNGDSYKATSAAATEAALHLNASIQRQRSGRLYQQASQPIESYAAAYAAANAVDQTSTSHHPAQQASTGVDQGGVQSDSGAYASFGEALPQSIPHTSGQSSPLVSGASLARQLSNLNEYSTHPSYYANHMSPSSNEASYSGQPSTLSGYYPASIGNQHSQHHHHYKSGQAAGLPYGYPSNVYDRAPTSYYDRAGHHAIGSTPFWPSSGLNSGGGLMTSASHALSHWTNGFSIGEIICGLVALTIGAVILGAPFFLIYLALMGNFSGSGTLSLTNPTSPSGAGGATQANGRRKRLAVFETMNMNEQASRHPDLAAMASSFAKQLSPHVNIRQISETFEHLIKSIEKYSSNEATHMRSANKQKSL